MFFFLSLNKIRKRGCCQKSCTQHSFFNFVPRFGRKLLDYPNTTTHCKYILVRYKMLVYRRFYINLLSIDD